MTYLWNHAGQDRPIGSQGVYPDHVGFILAPTVMVAALLRRRLTGRGAFIDLAQVEGTAYTLGVPYLETAVNGGEREPRGNRQPTAAPHGCYPCQGDDRWCVLSVKTHDQWQEFCRILGRPELAADLRFASLESRQQHADELDEIVEGWTRLRAPEEVVECLQNAGIAAGAVQNGADLVRDLQLGHREYFESFTESPIGAFQVPRSALKFQGMADDPLTLPSPLGRDTDSILRDLLGYDDTTLAHWHQEGVLS